jgi:hypothetical protein
MNANLITKWLRDPPLCAGDWLGQQMRHVSRRWGVDQVRGIG